VAQTGGWSASPHERRGWCALEQLLVDERDAEAQLMNAHIYQWRFGTDYASDLSRNTAQTLDRWRQP
jgi:hypothetical protein